MGKIEDTSLKACSRAPTAYRTICTRPLAARDHVNLFLYDGAIVPDPDQIITGGHDNKTARMIAFYAGDPINAVALTTMIKQIIANNRAGGWRKLKAAG